jgi:hypothetical protein
MRRHLATVSLLLAGAAGLAGLTAACTSDRDADPGRPAVSVRESCADYTRLFNQWSVAYGAELGAVGQAAAAGDRQRQETAVPVVRELFLTTAEELHGQAGRAADQELAGALTEAADGLVEIAEQIETYDDVTEAPALMSTGRFEAGGERVSAICAD